MVDAIIIKKNFDSAVAEYQNMVARGPDDVVVLDKYATYVGAHAENYSTCLRELIDFYGGTDKMLSELRMAEAIEKAAHHTTETIATAYQDLSSVCSAYC